MTQPSLSIKYAPDQAPRPSLSRVRAQVALALLEGLRQQDRPEEVLEDENVTLTLPRRFGLSDVVEAQIRRYQDEARRGRRISAEEVVDLIRLVIRRPDAEEVFAEVGRALAGGGGSPRGKVLPERLRLALARRRVRRRVTTLFGRGFLVSTSAPFHFEGGTEHLLWIGDPGGAACSLITGLAEVILGGICEGERVEHPECRGRGDERCIWGWSPSP